MDIQLLKTLHVAGIIMLFTSLGAILAGACDDCRKKAMIMHGISLLLLLGGGLHMLFAYGLNKGGWWHAKLVIWLFLGVAPVLAKKNILPRGVVLMLCVLAGIAAAFLGLKKPF